jgi:hypothetical protein
MVRKCVPYNLHFRFNWETRLSYLEFINMSDGGQVKVKQQITAVVTKTFDSCIYSAIKPTDTFLKTTLRTTQTTFCHG